jgi:hypothetical protein
MHARLNASAAVYIDTYTYAGPIGSRTGLLSLKIIRTLTHMQVSVHARTSECIS